MTVTTIASIAATIARTPANQTTKAASLLGSLLSTSKTDNTLAQDGANFSAAITLQNQTAQLRVASQNISQSSALLATAQQGATSIVNDLGRLKELATRAADSTISDDERASINVDFTTIRARIDRTAKSATFNNEALLTGASPQLKIAKESTIAKDLSVGSLTDDALFQGAALNIGTPAGAKAAEEIIKQAQTYANQQLDNVKALQAGLEQASSSLETAIQNQEASRSTLSADDFTSQLLQATTITQKDDFTPLNAQVKRLPPSLLQLLN